MGDHHSYVQYMISIDFMECKALSKIDLTLHPWKLPVPAKNACPQFGYDCGSAAPPPRLSERRALWVGPQ